MFNFDKLKASASRIAKQSVQVISNIASTVIENASTINSTNGLFGNGNNGYLQVELTKEELQTTFDNIIRIIQELSKDQDIGASMVPFETDPRLNYSAIGLELKKLIQILKLDSEKWLAVQRKVKHPQHQQQTQAQQPADGENEDDIHNQSNINIHLEESDIPCIDHFIQSNMIQTLCNHVQSDLPRGIMPLVLKALTLLFKSVPYPLLPHQSIHRPIAKLISTAARYDAFIGVFGEHNKTPAAKEQYNNYRKRIDITLTGLLKVLWRKIHENPPVLDYFILTDKRSLRLGIENGFDLYKSPKSFKPSISPAEVHRMQIDMLYALLPLIYEPKLSIHVQESILMALYLPDERIQQFLATNTKFVDILVNAVCESFKEALIFLAQQQQQTTSSSTMGHATATVPSYLQILGNFGSCTGNSASGSSSDPLKTPVKSRPSADGPITPGIAPASQTAQDGNQGVSNIHNVDGDNNPVLKFCKTVSFLHAVYQVVSRQIHEKLVLQQAEAPADEVDNSGDGTLTGVIQGLVGPNLMVDLSQTFNRVFLQQTITPCMETSKANEGFNTALYALLRILLVVLQQGQAFTALPADASHEIVRGTKDLMRVTESAMARARKTKQSAASAVSINPSTVVTEDESSPTTPASSTTASVVQDSENASIYSQSSKKKDLSINTQVPAISGATPSVLGQVHHTRAITLSLLSLTIRHLMFGSSMNPVSTSTTPYATMTPSSSRITPANSLQYSAFYWSLLDRMTSYSKSLSLASMNLVNELLVMAPPFVGQDMVILSVHPDVNYVCSEAKVFSSLDLKTFSLEDAIGRACKSIEFERSQSTRQLVVSSVSLTKYIDQSVKILLRRLMHAGDSHINQPGHNGLSPVSSTTSTTTPGTTQKSANADHFLDRILKKLQTYMTLRVDEQLTLSGLLRETTAIVAMSILLVPRSYHLVSQKSFIQAESEETDETLAKKMLTRLLVLLKKVTGLKNEMVAQHLKQIPDSLKKLDVLREYLLVEVAQCFSNSTDSITTSSMVDSDPNSSSDGAAPSAVSKEVVRQQQIRRFLENESMDNKRILVGVYTLQEMQAELQAFLFAIQVIRNNTHWCNSSLSFSSGDSGLFEGEQITINNDHNQILFGGRYVNAADREELEEYEQDIRDIKELVKVLSTSSTSSMEGSTSGKKLFDVDKGREDFIREFQIIESQLDLLSNRE